MPLALGLEGKSSIAGLVGPGALQVWGLMLTAGGLLVIFGMVMGRPRREHAGLVLLGYGALAYAVSIVVVNGIRGIIAASIIGAFGLACISHARVLNLGR